MKMTLKSYVYFNAAPDGVYFRAGSDSLFIRGAGIYALVSTVLKNLNGRHSVDEIAAALPDKARGFVRDLIAQLQDKHMVRVVPDDHLERIGAPLQELYGDTLNYLKDASADYVAAFLRWREQPIHVGGAGHSLKAAIRALARSGVRDLAIALEEGSAGPGREELEAALCDQGALDPGFRYRFVDAAELAGPAAAAGELLYLYVNDMLAPGAALLNQLLASGHPVLAAGVVYGKAVLGPDPVNGNVVLQDLFDRLHDSGDAVPYPPVALSILGNLCAVELLAQSAGIRRDNAASRLGDRFLHVKHNGEISLHALAPSIGLGERAPMPADVLGSADTGATGFAQLHAALHGLFDPLAGVFRHELDHGVRAIPLCHARMRAYLPNRFGGTALDALGWGASQDEANGRALVAAAEQYARRSAAMLGLAEAAEIVGDVDAERWQRRALAHALLRTQAFAAEGVRYRLDPAELKDASLVAALRILALFTPAAPAVALDTLPGYPVFRAAVDVDGHRADAIADDAVQALQRALSDVIGQFQVGAASPADTLAAEAAVPQRRDTLPLGDTALGAAFRIDPALLARRYRVVAKPFLADATLAAGPLVLGSVSLQARDGE